VKGIALVAVAALVLIGTASARNHYLPMHNAPLVAKTYEHYLRCLSVRGCQPGQTPTFEVRCKAPSAYVVRCVGRASSNNPDPAHRWTPYSVELRKLGPWRLERRIGITKPIIENLHHPGIRAGINMRAW
jgi:hypothetical protein